MAGGFADVLSRSINANIRQIYMVLLFGLLFVVGRIMIRMYNHSSWSGVDPLVPGVYNPN